MARPSAFTFPPNVNEFWNPISMPCAPQPPDLKVCSPAPASKKSRSSKNSSSFANNEGRALPSEHVSPRRQHLDSCRAGSARPRAAGTLRRSRCPVPRSRGCVRGGFQVPADAAEKRGIPRDDVLASLSELRAIVEAVEADFYRSFEQQARQRLRGRDEADWPILATALGLGCGLWTEDQDFFGTGVAVWTTNRIEILLEQESS